MSHEIGPPLALAVATIVGMGLVTYLTRAGGVWVMAYVPITRRIETFLRHLASSVLVAVVTAAAARGDRASILALVVSVAVFATTRSTIRALVAAMGSAAAWRATIGG